jgi:hypothetical protein
MRVTSRVSTGGTSEPVERNEADCFPKSVANASSDDFSQWLIADVISDAGAFMQNVGAAWLMVRWSHSAPGRFMLSCLEWLKQSFLRLSREPKNRENFHGRTILQLSRASLKKSI